MHEWAIAESIVLYLREQGIVKARRLKVSIGKLQSIDKDLLHFALNELLRSEGLEIDEVNIVEENPVLACKTCGNTWLLDMSSLPEDVAEAIHFIPEAIHAYYKCPQCGSRDFEVIQGRGISKIEVIFQ